MNQNLITIAEHQEFLQILKRQTDKAYYLVRQKGVPVATINFEQEDDVCYWGCNIADGKVVIPGLFMGLMYIAGDYCFDKLKCRFLKSRVLKHNIAPQKANDFLGIKRSLHGAGHVTDRGGMDVIEYIISLDEWKDVSSRLLSVLPSQMKIYVKSTVYK